MFFLFDTAFREKQNKSFYYLWYLLRFVITFLGIYQITSICKFLPCIINMFQAINSSSFQHLLHDKCWPDILFFLIIIVIIGMSIYSISQDIRLLKYNWSSGVPSNGWYLNTYLIKIVLSMWGQRNDKEKTWKWAKYRLSKQKVW